MVPIARERLGNFFCGHDIEIIVSEGRELVLGAQRLVISAMTVCV
jgi:hypothetical protein